MSLPNLDKWDGFELVGAALLGGGIWAQWGPQWACMFWGALLLGMALLRSVRMGGRSARQSGVER